MRPLIDAFWAVYLEPAPGAAFSGDGSLRPDQPMLVAENGEAWLLAELADAAGRSVAWSDGVLSGIPADALIEGDEQQFMVRGNPEVTFAPVLELPHRRIPLGDVRTTAAEAAAHLEIVSAHGFLTGRPIDHDTMDWVEWVQLRARVRDHRGQLVLGMPVEWSVIEGRAFLETRGSQDASGWWPQLPDYAQVADICLEPRAGGPPRTATVEARLGSLRDVITISFDASLDHPADDWPGYEWLAMCQGPDAPLERGCACASSPGRRRPILGLLALALVGVRRRPRPWTLGDKRP